MHPLERSRFLKLAGSAGLCASLPRSLLAADTPSVKPNIVLCGADALGPDLGAHPVRTLLDDLFDSLGFKLAV